MKNNAEITGEVKPGAAVVPARGSEIAEFPLHRAIVKIFVFLQQLLSPCRESFSISCLARITGGLGKYILDVSNSNFMNPPSRDNRGLRSGNSIAMLRDANDLNFISPRVVKSSHPW